MGWTGANGRAQRSIRSDTSSPRESRVLRLARSLEPGQAELARTLARIREATSSFLEFKEIDEMGLTVAMLAPVLDQLLRGSRKRGTRVSRLGQLASSLQARMGPAQYNDYAIRLDDPKRNPLELYGSRNPKRALAIHLARDYRTVGDRAVVEACAAELSGLPVSDIRAGLKPLKPHITIGEVQYDRLSRLERAKLHADPSKFIADAVAMYEQAIGVEASPLIFPEAISLNGLRATCELRSASR